MTTAVLPSIATVIATIITAIVAAIITTAGMGIAMAAVVMVFADIHGLVRVVIMLGRVERVSGWM